MSWSKAGRVMVMGSVALLGLVLLAGHPAAQATSGACSWHGGVNCAAGPGIYGQVICNDGWTGSSVSYNSMVECEGYSFPSYPTIPSCPLNSSYDSLSGSCKCFVGYSAVNGQCVSLNQQCIDRLGVMSEYNLLTDTCECFPGYTIYGGQCVSETMYCTDQFGYNAEYDFLTGKCKCQLGYVTNASGDGCISGDSYCAAIYGYYSSFDVFSKTCSCDTGYELQNGTCEAIPVVSVPPPIIHYQSIPSISTPPAPVAPVAAPKPPVPPKTKVMTVPSSQASSVPSSTPLRVSSTAASSTTSTSQTAIEAQNVSTPQVEKSFLSRVWDFFYHLFL